MKDETKNEHKSMKPFTPFTFEIPICCREGLSSCKHVPKKQRKIKQNVGL